MMLQKVCKAIAMHVRRKRHHLTTLWSWFRIPSHSLFRYSECQSSLEISLNAFKWIISCCIFSSTISDNEFVLVKKGNLIFKGYSFHSSLHTCYWTQRLMEFSNLAEKTRENSQNPWDRMSLSFWPFWHTNFA